MYIKTENEDEFNKSDILIEESETITK